MVFALALVGQGSNSDSNTYHVILDKLLNITFNFFIFKIEIMRIVILESYHDDYKNNVG